MDRAAVRYDRAGDQHYDVISAFIKSIRGSDADAAVHYLARMIEAGEDARFIARRLIVHASEDVGMADPTALPVAVAAAQAVEFVGLPEARINLAQATIHLALAPKSNAVVRAIGAARPTCGRAGPARCRCTCGTRTTGARPGWATAAATCTRTTSPRASSPSSTCRTGGGPPLLRAGPAGAEARYAERSERIRAALPGAGERPGGGRPAGWRPARMVAGEPGGAGSGSGGKVGASARAAAGYAAAAVATTWHYPD